MKIKTLARILVILALWFTGCNPYKQLGSHPPLTPKDSTNLLARCVQLIKVNHDTLEFLHVVYDTVQYREGFDSLIANKIKVHDSLVIKYRDTCKEVPYSYEDGFNTGFDAGVYDGKLQESRIAQKRMDSLNHALTNRADSMLVMSSRAYELRLTDADNTAGIANTQRDKYRLQAERRSRLNFWLLAWAALMTISSILLWKFRRQQKAANNIINDIKNLKP